MGQGVRRGLATHQEGPLITAVLRSNGSQHGQVCSRCSPGDLVTSDDTQKRLLSSRQPCDGRSAHAGGQTICFSFRPKVEMISRFGGEKVATGHHILAPKGGGPGPPVPILHVLPILPWAIQSFVVPWVAATAHSPTFFGIGKRDGPIQVDGPSATESVAQE